jgi:hypothetical protein
MAHIHNDEITIKVSKLVKGDHEQCDDAPAISEDVCIALESVVTELLGDPSLVVEVTRG